MRSAAREHDTLEHAAADELHALTVCVDVVVALSLDSGTAHSSETGWDTCSESAEDGGCGDKFLHNKKRGRRKTCLLYQTILLCNLLVGSCRDVYTAPMKFSAILFDLDGTLVETIDLYYQACAAAFATEKISLSREAFKDHYVQGWSLERWKRELTGGKDDNAANIRAKRDEFYIQLLSEKSEYIPGSKELLSHTKDHPRAIITGSWKSYVDAINSKLSIHNHFTEIITCDDLGNFHKPHPHGLLIACERLSVKPEDCIMIGDQTFDVDAANAIGMTSCLVWSGHTPRHAAGKADIEVQTLKEILKHL